MFPNLFVTISLAHPATGHEVWCLEILVVQKLLLWSKILS